MRCPLCQNEGNAYTKDGRNRFYCPTCLYEDVLIEALTIKKENDKLNMLKTNNKNYLANQKSHSMS